MTALRRLEIYLTPEEYLAAEQISEIKHEYLAGVVFAMAVVSRAHCLIVGNIASELRSQLRGKRCVPLTNDMRLRIRRTDATFYYYPDVIVDCSGSEADEVEEPAVIFEVLSPESDRGDYGDKRLNYQQLTSLRMYAIVEQERAAVTVYRRAGEGWTTELLADLDATLALPEIECSLPLRSVYERVSWAG